MLLPSHSSFAGQISELYSSKNILHLITSNQSNHKIHTFSHVHTFATLIEFIFLHHHVVNMSDEQRWCVHGPDSKRWSLGYFDMLSRYWCLNTWIWRAECYNYHGKWLSPSLLKHGFRCLTWLPRLVNDNGGLSCMHWDPFTKWKVLGGRGTRQTTPSCLVSS